MRIVAMMVIASWLACLADMAAAQSATDWAVGIWQGHVGADPNKIGYGRVLRVEGVRSDGVAFGAWAVTGKGFTAAKIQAEAGKLTVITAADSRVVLERKGDADLGGTMTLKSGVQLPATLRRVMVTNFDGPWRGKAQPESNDCSAGEYRVTVKDGRIFGAVEFTSERRGRVFRSNVSGVVAADGKANLLLLPAPGETEARSSRFAGTFADASFIGGDKGPNCSYEVRLSRR